MKRLRLALVLSSALLAGCSGSRTSDAFALGSLPTSPAGVADTAPPSHLQRLVHRARESRGNPISLGVLTGTVLLGALAFGAYTILLAYRESPGTDRERRSSRAA
jgi:hypothetical protein